MSCFLEIMHYMLKQLITNRIDEDSSFEMFKTLLLRHAIQRPPHSLAIFSLQDVKDIDLFVLDTFYRHYDMYKYALTVEDQLHLCSRPAMKEMPELKASDLRAAREIRVTEIDIMQEYMSQEEREAMRREKEYMEHGAGKVEAILNEEMGRLFSKMEEKMKL